MVINVVIFSYSSVTMVTDDVLDKEALNLSIKVGHSVSFGRDIAMNE